MRSLLAGTAAASLTLALGCALPAQAAPESSPPPESGSATESSAPSFTPDPEASASEAPESQAPESSAAPSADASKTPDKSSAGGGGAKAAKQSKETKASKQDTKAKASEKAEKESPRAQKLRKENEKLAKELKRDRDDGLDEYYPELAKQLFDQDGDGNYEIGDPAKGGKSTGIVPSGLSSYYAQKVDWSSKNCLGLGAGQDFLDKYESELGRKILCGYVIAPIDAKNPATGNVAIAAMKVPAAKKSKGSVFWNPGGPGGEGLTLGLSGAVFEPELAKDYDMVGFDPRGTGSSMPFSQCSSDEDLDKDRASTALTLPQKEAEKSLNQDAERYTNDCFRNTGKAFGLDKKGREALVQHLGTWDAVGDLDLMRSVVGDQKLQYVGFSYGTRLGYVYAQKFQPSAGRLVLDGVVDPGDDSAAIKALKELNHSSDRWFDPSSKDGVSTKAEPSDDEISPEDSDTIAQGAGFQDTFEQFALNCSAQADGEKTWGDVYPDLFEEGGTLQGDPFGIEEKTFSCPLGDGIDDPEQLTANNAALLQTLLEKNDGKGVPSGLLDDDRNVTFSDARTGEIQALYSKTLWGPLAAGLYEVSGGETAGLLMILADQYNERDAESGHYDPMLQAFTNIRCTDENVSQQLKDPEVAKEYEKYLRQVGKAYDEAAPFQASGKVIGEHDYCDFWKFSGTLPQPQKLTQIPNVLVVSTSHDPATPYAAGPKLARMIDGTLLSVSGASHTSYMADSKCTDDTVNEFLTKGDVPKDGEFGPKLDKPDKAKDDKGHEVTFNKECQMKTFRSSDFVTSTDKAYAEDKVGFRATHVDSESDYSVTLTEVKGGAGNAVPAAVKGKVGSVTTDNGGNVKGSFKVPAKTAKGLYQVALVDGSGDVVASRPLTVQEHQKKPEPKPTGSPDPTPQPTDSPDPKPSSPGTGSPSDGAGSGDGSGPSESSCNGGNSSSSGSASQTPVSVADGGDDQAGGDDLSSTGAEVTGWVIGGGLALLAGAALLATSMVRRKGRH